MRPEGFYFSIKSKAGLPAHRFYVKTLVDVFAWRQGILKASIVVDSNTCELVKWISQVRSLTFADWTFALCLS